MNAWLYERTILQDSEIVEAQPNTDLQILDEFGSDGWELVAAVRVEAGIAFFFKKPVAP